MSRAFVKETDDAGEPLPELSISPYPNFATPAGLALIEARVTALETDLRAARAGDEVEAPGRVAQITRLEP
jgi:transcription elongation factor GreB